MHYYPGTKKRDQAEPTRFEIEGGAESSQK